jgi:hypothetical protein
MEIPKLDRTAFWAGTHKENEKRTRKFWSNQSIRARLEAAAYLNSVAYNYDINNPPKMDRTYFSMRKNG